MIGLVERFAGCFHDQRRPDLTEHDVRTLFGQRIFGIALGYEDMNDYDQLRHDPVMATVVGADYPSPRLRAIGGKRTLTQGDTNPRFVVTLSSEPRI